MVIIHRDFRLRVEQGDESTSYVLVYSDKKSTLLSLFEDCPSPERSKKRSLGIPWKWVIPSSRGRTAAVIGGVAMNIDNNPKNTKKIRKRKNEASRQ